MGLFSLGSPRRMFVLGSRADCGNCSKAGTASIRPLASVSLRAGRKPELSGFIETLGPDRQAGAKGHSTGTGGNCLPSCARWALGRKCLAWLRRFDDVQQPAAYFRVPRNQTGLWTSAASANAPVTGHQARLHARLRLGCRTCPAAFRKSRMRTKRITTRAPPATAVPPIPAVTGYSGQQTMRQRAEIPVR
jgi:hypothetical protein